MIKFRMTRFRKFRSLRFRLTAPYLAFFSLLFILFSGFLYGILSHALETRLDETLSSEANTLTGLLEDELEEMHGDARLAAHEAVTGMRLHGGLAVILAGSEVLASSSPLPPRQVDGIIRYAAANPSAEFVMTQTQMGRFGTHIAVQ